MSETSNTKPHEVTNNPKAQQETTAQLEAVVPGFSQKFKDFFMNKIPPRVRENLKNFKDELIDFLKKNWGLVSGVT